MHGFIAIILVCVGTSQDTCDVLVKPTIFTVESACQQDVLAFASFLQENYPVSQVKMKCVPVSHEGEPV